MNQFNYLKLQWICQPLQLPLRLPLATAATTPNDNDNANDNNNNSNNNNNNNDDDDLMKEGEYYCFSKKCSQYRKKIHCVWQ